MNKIKKNRGTQSTYKYDNGETLCDIVELAEHFAKNVGNIPETVGFGRACEIHLLAKAFLVLDNKYNNKKKGYSHDKK